VTVPYSYNKARKQHTEGTPNNTHTHITHTRAVGNPY